MTTKILKYTDKLNANLNTLRKEIIRINLLPVEKRQEEIIKLYTYFKQKTDIKVKLFDENDDDIYKCLNIKECIKRDIEYLKNKCNEEKQEYCKGLVDNINKEFENIIGTIEQKAEIILSKEKELNDLVNEFIEHLKNKKDEQFKQISKILNEDINRENIDNYKKEIYEHFKSLEPDLEKYGNSRIIWINKGFLNDKNRQIEDWFSRIKTLFETYDELRKHNEINIINFNSVENGGLTEIEDMIDVYYHRQEEKDKGKLFEKQGKNEVELIYETDKVLIISPKTQKSAVYWGQKTKWCTSRYLKGKRNEKEALEENLFYDYHKDTVRHKLYIILFKEGKEFTIQDVNIIDIDKLNKFQIHFNTAQFMDYNDDDVNILSNERKGILFEWFEKLEKNNNYLGIVNCYKSDEEKSQVILDEYYEYLIDKINNGEYNEKLYVKNDIIIFKDEGELYKQKDFNNPPNSFTRRFKQKFNGKVEYKFSYYERGFYESKKIYYNDNDEVHRVNGPAIIEYYEDNTNGNKGIKKEDYYINGKKHRENKPASITYYENNNIEKEEYYINGKKHREDGPASIKYFEFKRNNIHIEMYYIDNKKHREDGPAYIKYFEDKTKGKDGISEEIYYINNKQHRENGASSIEYFEDKTKGNNGIRKEDYTINGKYHRVGEPAIIYYKELSNDKSIEYYYIDGQLHREDGPAVIFYLKDKTKGNNGIDTEAYYMYGKEHREKGPAIIEYYENGRIKNEEYYINGTKIKN